MSTTPASAVSPAPDTPDTPALDHTVLNILLDSLGDAAEFVLPDLVEAYVQDTPTYVERLELASAEGDLDQVRRQAHAMKSSSATLGAVRLAEVCKQLEHAARHDDAATVARLTPGVRPMYEAVEREMLALVA